MCGTNITVSIIKYSLRFGSNIFVVVVVDVAISLLFLLAVLLFLEIGSKTYTFPGVENLSMD